MTQEPQQHQSATRRGVLLGVGVAGLGALAGCSTKAIPYDSNEAGTEIVTGSGDIPVSPAAAAATAAAAASTPAPAASPTTEKTTKTTASDSGGSEVKGTLLADVSEIPVGEGKIFAAEKVVVTQPVKGEIRAFSAVCTHVGCILDKVEGGKIYCPCHGAVFKVSNGVPVAGPTSVPLPEKKVALEGDKIVLQ